MAVAGLAGLQILAQFFASASPVRGMRYHADMTSHPLDFPVFQRLTHSRANLEQSLNLGDGMAMAVWRNRHDAVRYHAPGHHTLSLYLQGGLGTFRRDYPNARGAPGRLCLLGDNEESDWVVNGDLHFLHLYIPPAVLGQYALALTGQEPRMLGLPQAPFFDDAELAERFARLLNLPAHNPDACVQGNILAHDILAALIGRHGSRKLSPRITGGLAPAVRRHLIEWLEAHLDQPLTLSAMARQAHLSEYHFARMFRVSFGVPPQTWLHALRIRRASTLLRQGRLPLADIALACGFGSASHFSNRFKQACGITPSRYRELSI